MKNFLKPFIGVISGLLLLSGVFAMVQWNNSKLELSQKSMVFTDDGTVGGDMVAWINTGGDSIFYGPLLDGLLNPYITGGALGGYSTGVSLWEYTGNVLKPITTSQVKLAGGNSNAANGDYSVALGLANTANGKAAVAIGRGASAIADGSTALGGGRAEGFYSLAAGSNTKALSNYSIALGKDSQAIGYTSVAIGYEAIASGSQAVSIGHATSASGDASTALGYFTNAVGFTSTAMGYNTNAAGMHSTTMGYYTNAWGDHSIAMGYNADANGIRSISIGDNTKANGGNSTAMGYGTIANGDYSTAMGQLSIAQGNFSSAHGLSTQANRQAATTVGQYNSGNRSSLFQVGIGIDNTDRRNGFEVTDLGNIFMNELTGYTCLATDSAGMVYDNTGVFANYIPYTSVDTGFNNTGSDTIIPSEKLVWSLVSGLNNDYIPIWSGGKLVNSIRQITGGFMTANDVIRTNGIYGTRADLYGGPYISGFDDNSRTLNLTKTKSGRAMGINLYSNARGVFIGRDTLSVPDNYTAFVIGNIINNPNTIRDSNTGANFRIDMVGNTYTTGKILANNSITSNSGFCIGTSCITGFQGLPIVNLTQGYMPFWSGNSFYNSNIFNSGGNTYISSLPSDGEFPAVTIDGSGKLYQSKNVGVYGYITNSITNTTSNGNWYPISGAFTNEVIEGFIGSGDMIVYKGNTKRVKMNMYRYGQTNTAGTTLSIGVKKNGVLLTGSKATVRLANAADYSNATSISQALLSSGDTIQLVISSNKNAVLTAENVVASLNSFY